MKDNQQLVSIEHNPDWHMKVSEYINTRPDINQRFTYMFKPELYGYQHGYAQVNEEHPHGLDDYLWPKHPRVDISNAEVYFVDGIGRAATALIVKMLSQKENPVIYIHDYYGREQWYTWSSQFFSKKEKVGLTLCKALEMKVHLGRYPKSISKDRKIKIQIDPWDTWSTDHTLSLIIHPLLVQLQKTKHGSPNVDDNECS